MLIVRLDSLSLCNLYGTGRTLAQSSFGEALRSGSQTPHHFDGNIQWAIVEDLFEGAKLIAAQLRQVYSSRLQSLGLTPADLEFTVNYAPVQNQLVWAADRYMNSSAHSVALGMQACALA